jgi:CspA family cold shock protein
MKGTIKKLTDRGFGFISLLTGGKDLFFHSKDCTNNDFEQMQEGDAVTFEESTSDRGPCAVNVMRDTEA